jgi:hypothetical protein
MVLCSWYPPPPDAVDARGRNRMRDVDILLYKCIYLLYTVDMRHAYIINACARLSAVSVTVLVPAFKRKYFRSNRCTTRTGANMVPYVIHNTQYPHLHWLFLEPHGPMIIFMAQHEQHGTGYASYYISRLGLQ